MFRLLISSLFVSFSVAQNLQCNRGATEGPPVNGACVEGTVLAVDESGNEVCCPPNATTTITATTAASTTCVDRLNPRTGVSDCPQRASLCNDATYYDVMTIQCPRTCNRCNATSATTTASGACVDLVNPRTGVSDCPALSYLCNDSNYTEVMNRQCRKTCGRCGSTGTTAAGTATTATTTAATGTCRDLPNPRTGVSDCASRRDLCNNSAYTALMRQQCPATCGFC